MNAAWKKAVLEQENATEVVDSLFWREIKVTLAV